MFFSFLTDEQNQTIFDTTFKFRGQASTLESALGAVIVGHRYGWRVLKVIHSPATYKKYEKILGIQFQDICEERGPLAKRSVGLSLADKLNSFWAVATGKKKIPDKGTIADEKDIERELKNVQ